MKTTIFAFSIMLLLSTFSYSQTIREDLYVSGKLAYDADEYKESALKLFAYREMNLSYLKENDTAKLTQLDNALDYSRNRLFVLGGIKPGQPNKNSFGKLKVNAMVLPDASENYILLNGKNFSLKSIELEEHTVVLDEGN